MSKSGKKSKKSDKSDKTVSNKPKRQGRPRRPGVYVPTSIRLPKDLFNRLHEFTEKSNISITDSVITALVWWLKTTDDKRDKFMKIAEKMEYVFGVS